MSKHLPKASIKFNCKPVRTRCFVVLELVKRIYTFFYCYQALAAFCFFVVKRFKLQLANGAEVDRTKLPKFVFYFLIRLFRKVSNP